MPKEEKRFCEKHGDTLFILEGRGYFRCKKCRSECVQRHRLKVKEELVARFGGKCCTCGYSGYVGALEFHHVDPSKKEFGLSRNGVTRSFKRILAEAKKCILLCANCHREVEAGIRSLPFGEGSSLQN